MHLPVIAILVWGFFPFVFFLFWVGVVVKVLMKKLNPVI
jgi:hypothetical protein